MPVRELIQNIEAPGEGRRRQRLVREMTRRNISDSVVAPEVRKALRALARVLDGRDDAVVIGGLALGAYAQPRYTEDVDILVADEVAAGAIIDAAVATGQFARATAHTTEHKDTGVIVEIVTPGTTNTDRRVADFVIGTAELHEAGGRVVRVASPTGIIASKIGRATTGANKAKAYIDKGDIVGLIQAHGAPDLSAVMDAFSPDERDTLAALMAEADGGSG